MMAQAESGKAHADHEVFSFCGHIEGSSVADLRSGYVVAITPAAAIESMRACGFTIKAVSSLAEVKQMIDILEKIATQHPEVEASEFIDALDQPVSQYAEENVFCFSGHVVSPSGSLKSGFMVASDIQFVTDFLHGLGFVVESASSLTDLRRVMGEMMEVAGGNDNFPETHFVNFKVLA